MWARPIKLVLILSLAMLHKLGGVPGPIVFTRLMQIPFLCQSLACDHFAKHCENTAASHHYPRAHRSPRAAQEKLWLKLWLTADHQRFPRLSAVVKGSRSCGVGLATQELRVPLAMLH